MMSRFKTFQESKSQFSKIFQNRVMNSNILYSSETMKTLNDQIGRCFFHRLIPEMFVLQIIASLSFKFTYHNCKYWFYNRLKIWILFEQMRLLENRAMDENWKDSETAILRYEHSLHWNTYRSKLRLFKNLAESRTVTVCVWILPSLIQRDLKKEREKIIIDYTKIIS